MLHSSGQRRGHGEGQRLFKGKSSSAWWLTGSEDKVLLSGLKGAIWTTTSGLLQKGNHPHEELSLGQTLGL